MAKKYLVLLLLGGGLFLSFFVSCQSTALGDSSPYPVTLNSFTNSNLYGIFVGSSKSFTTRNADDSLLWNNCFNFSPPPLTNDINSLATYDWHSPVFGNQSSANNHVFFPNAIVNTPITNSATATMATNLFVQKNYFVMRYDITDGSLDNYDSWEPVNDSDDYIPGNFRNAFAEALAQGSPSGTLSGMSLFLVVYFKNFTINSTNNLKEVDFNFGATPYFTPTSSFSGLSGADLRTRYQEISDTLVDRTKELAAGLQSPFFSRYYESTNSNISAASEHSFPDNPNTKVCP